MILYDPDLFFNREEEIAAFNTFQQHPRQRILLLFGQERIGKSYLLRRLLDEYDRDTPLALVDFDDPDLEYADQLLLALADQLGGELADRLDEVAQQLSAELPAAVGPDGNGGAEPAGAGVTVREISGTVNVGGSIAGRDVNIYNAPVTIVPGRGTEIARDERARRLGRAFRDALRDRVSEGPVVLLFDHYDQAAPELARWLQEQLMGLHLSPAPRNRFSQLWLVLAGRRLPYQDESDVPHSSLSRQRLGPFNEETIRLFWIEKHGLDPVHLPTIIAGTAGMPELLVSFARNIRQAQGRNGG